MEAEFKELLEGIQPMPLLLKLFKAMFIDAYEMHMAQAQDRLKAFRQESIDLEKQIAGLAERVVDASKRTTIAADEKKIDLLKKKILLGWKNLSDGYRTKKPKAICLNSRFNSSQTSVK